ncbi:MAG: type I methionyl aminopeptidase [Prevotellaceae bacterium]|nr:type I methionyl aminopeptidase [Prevotellaceae bacterium]
MKIFLKTEDEIDLMRKANRLVGATLAELGKHIQAGVTTLQLDKIAEEFIRDHGAVPTFKNFPNPFGGPFPASICTSVNDVVVHGIPSDKQVLKDGDIISIDCGTLLDGFNGDSCYTFCVGEVRPEVMKLLRTTRASLYKGIAEAIAGNHLGDIGNAVQTTAEAEGYGVVRELTGHGIGKEMHEAPQVPNYGNRGNGVMLKAGMCIAIEPMITMGDRKIWLLPDKWGIITRDRQPAAHFEHTIAIRRGKAEILSTFDDIDQERYYNQTVN